MFNTARTKALILSILFVGLAFAGVGLLATQGTETQVRDVTTPRQTEPTNGQVTSPEADDGTSDVEPGSEEERQGPPPLFPSLTTEPLTGPAWLQAFTDLYKESAEQFRERALQALNGPYPREAREAALAVWYRWNYEDRLSPFHRILIVEDDIEGTSANNNQDLLPFAVDFLTKEANKAADARGVLADYIDSKPTDPALRKQAWASVLRWGRIGEIHRSLASLYAERDPDCIQAAGRALHDTKEGGSRAILMELSKRHPQRASRKQFKELLSQR